MKVEAEFNDSFSGETNRAERIDLEQIRKGLTACVASQVADMVGLAKEEALGRMGER